MTFACSVRTLDLYINPLNAKLNPIFLLLALLGAHPILHVSRIGVNYFILNIALLHHMHEGRKLASFLETILKTPKQNRNAELYNTVAVESVRKEHNIQIFSIRVLGLRGFYKGLIYCCFTESLLIYTGISLTPFQRFTGISARESVHLLHLLSE